MTAAPAVGARIQLFGSILLEADGPTLHAQDFGGRKPKQVLQQLLLRGGRVVTTEELAAQLWAGQPPPDEVATLRHYVSVLRRRLRWAAPGLADLVVTERSGYRVDTSMFWLDLTAFDEIVDALARPAILGTPGGLQPEAAAPRDLIAEGLALLVGEVLADEPEEAWALLVRERYQRRLAQFALLAGTRTLAAGEAERTIALVRLVLDRQPAAEAHCALLMAAYCLRGDRAAALAAFAACEHRLTEDLGVDPMPRTRAVSDAVRGGRPADQVVAAVLGRVVPQRAPTSPAALLPATRLRQPA